MISDRQPAYRIDPTRLLAAARSGSQEDFGQLSEIYRNELLTHCYRMLGSLHDAEDLVQETFLRAWRRLETYEGRASFRAWLYKIATNACLDLLDRRPKRLLPQDVAPAADPADTMQSPVTEPVWLEPFPDELLAPADNGPEALYDARESITLAFLAALQTLPPRQRAVLILRDVLDWQASEVSSLLEISVPAGNSLLSRARTTLADHYQSHGRLGIRSTQPDEQTRSLLQRYVRAWQEADVDGLVTLLKEDATFPMPPLPQWYQGKAAIRAFVAATILAGDARNRWRLTPVNANAQPAYAWFRKDEATGAYQAYAIQLLTYEGDLLSDITTMGYPELFPEFGLPLELA
jgi:RNA polymerase sigma-70 factor (ECF subfamily)